MSTPEESQSIRNYYAGQKLSSDALDRIHANAKLTRPAHFERGRLLAAAAAVAVLFMLGVFSWYALQPDATERIAAEVRTNYAKHLDPEVRAGDFELLAAGLSRLGFPLAPSGDGSQLNGWQVAGGRYCSLAGELAAQVNLTDAQGRKSLLYVVALSEALEKAEVGELSYADAKVHLWKDAGRLYVQAIPNG